MNAQIPDHPEWMLVVDARGNPIYWVASDGSQRSVDDPPPQEDWSKEMPRNLGDKSVSTKDLPTPRTHKTLYVCLPSSPWNVEMGTPVIHPYAQEISSKDGYPGGDIVEMRCPVCNHEWEMELPQ